MLKRHRRSCVVESPLPHDVVELILERLPVESLVRFKSVSKKWNASIKSQSFKERQFLRRRQSRGPDVLFVLLSSFGVDDDQNTDSQKFVFGSSKACTVRLPISSTTICHGSCDGLVCLYTLSKSGKPNVVVNPATRWHQSFPLSNIQQLLLDRFNKGLYGHPPVPFLGFGKDKFTGTYKPVWLYNSSELGLDNVTTCEVFDFTTNAWRYVLTASPYRILPFQKPVYLDGSLYWLTECEETKILSFDLHTETFQVISKAPSANLHNHPRNATLCILDNRLCFSVKNWPAQVIWSFDSSGSNQTWKELCSLDLTKTLSWFGEPYFRLSPIAILEKNKLLLQGRDSTDPLVLHDLHTKSYDLLFEPTNPVGSLYYFHSLFSAVSS